MSARISKKKSKNVPVAVLTIKVRDNNTFATLTDSKGDVLKSISSGNAAVGFKHAKKGTPFAAGMVVEVALKAAKEQFGVQTIKCVKINGFAQGRESVYGPLRKSPITICDIICVTPIKHGGCRGKGQRRI